MKRPWVLLLLAASAPCVADPVTLKCVADDGTPTEPIMVDLAKGTMHWGGSDYQIKGVTDRYITAIEEPSQTWEKVGGEIWVLDRVTLEYWRATAGFTSRGVNGRYTEPEMTLGSYRGRCSRGPAL